MAFASTVVLDCSTFGVMMEKCFPMPEVESRPVAGLEVCGVRIFASGAVVSGSFILTRGLIAGGFFAEALAVDRFEVAGFLAGGLDASRFGADGFDVCGLGVE
jgi:hypothetical protein